MSENKDSRNLTTLCYIEQDDRYLMMHRVSKKNDCNQGKWIGVGGHFKEGESPEECLLREVREETGLNVDKLTLCGVKQFPISGGRYIVFLFRGSRFSGELHSSPEGPVFWASRDELEGKRLCDNFTQMLSVFTDPDKSEMLWSTEDGEWKLEIL